MRSRGTSSAFVTTIMLPSTSDRELYSVQGGAYRHTAPPMAPPRASPPTVPRYKSLVMDGGTFYVTLHSIAAASAFLAQGVCGIHDFPRFSPRDR